MKSVDLTTGKETSVLTLLAIPIMGSSLLQFTYNLIDMLLVGRLGSNAVASIGSSSFFIGLGFSINSLVVMGTAIKVAHALGEKDYIQVKKYINAGSTINLIIAIAYGLLLVFGGKYLIGFLKLENAIVERDAYYYLAINGPVFLFNFFNILYSRILSSYGNNKLAFKINSIGLVLNIILDPLFIYVLDFGVVGAAYATLCAHIVMFILFRLRTQKTFKFDPSLGIDKEKIKEIIRLGIPISFQRILFTIINIFLARIIAIFGTEAIAAQKIGFQIESVSFMIIGGLNGAIAAFTGQNFGAKKYDRVVSGYYAALKIGITYSGIMTLIFLAFNVPLIKLFIRDELTISMASSYLIVLAFSQIFSAMEVITNGLFTGIGKPKIPSIISVVFTSLRIPFALILTIPFGVNGVWMSISLSSMLKGVVAHLVYKIKIRREFV
jgi:putative MATE family efflux protein